MTVRCDFCELTFVTRLPTDLTCLRCKKKGRPSQGEMEFESYQRVIRRVRREDKVKKRGRVKSA